MIVKYPSAALAVCAGLSALCVGSVFGDPVVPGFTVEVYASLDLPMRISFDGAGNLFVGNNSEWSDPTPISRIGPGGAPVEAYGPPVSDPDAIIVYDSSSLIPATDGSVLVGGVWGVGRGHVTEVLPDQSGQVLYGPSSSFLNPTDFAFDSQGRLLFTDYNTSKIFASTGAAPFTLVSLEAEPVAMAIDSLDRIFVWVEGGAIQIYEADGTLVDDSFATAAGGFPGLAFGPGGDWREDLHSIVNGELVRFAPDGVPTVLGSGFSADPIGVSDIKFGPDGALYASEYATNRILRIARDVSDAPSGATPTAEAKLSQNAPNPFGSDTRISLTLNRPGPVELDVYDVSGQRVRDLHTGELEAGHHDLEWDGRDHAGRKLPSGIYLYRLRQEGTIVQTRQARILR